MAFLMRQIKPERWIQSPHDISCKEEINADSLADLHAENNAISTWYIGDKTELEIRHAVVALASGFRQLDGMVIVYLDAEKIESVGIDIQATRGETKIVDYAELHRDISQLNSGRLLDLANLLLNQVDDGQTQIINTEEITLWLVECIKDGKLKFDDLHKDFKVGFAAKIQKLINKNKINPEEFNSDFQEEIKIQLALNKKKTNCKYELECERYNYAV